ncbi:DUF3043 domain-containing protein [Amycolatopsis vastitatis]|uniref:DUF3043 domain-containing protein n=1 Tax=Amycolatopsis vastitatis TaxID=1905142 RepID=A0A229SMY1_9PSEU|nr:DUF3043 domain-containing protein [Amycolatopsis vastitatis]OXM60385.1 hypothetical protein CF165_42985 [Amycolatopsis vastitatis]
MRFLRRSTTDTAADEPETADTVDVAGKAYTPGKGKATPKRRDAEAKRRGPVAPPPTTMREAMKRNKELRKANPQSKEERRAATKARRDAMMRGDDSVLPARDRGPVKAYVRDLVDSRRNLLGLFMPMAVLVFLSLTLQGFPQVQTTITLLCTVMLLVMAIEGFVNGRKIVKLVREKFPKETVSGRTIGMYAFVRASQIRPLRVPKPRLKPGDPIPN